ncbi:MAG: hypothetical protein V1779_11730 [bacterium]
MKKLLSVFLGIQRTYFAIVEPCKKGFELKYVQYDKYTPNLKDNEFTDISLEPCFKKISDELGTDIHGLNVIIPSDIAHYSLIPQPEKNNEQNLRKLCELEIRLNFPNNAYEDFSVTAIPLDNNIKEYKYLLMVFIHNTILDNCKLSLSDLNLPIEKIRTPVLPSMTSFFYNYPEVYTKISAIISFGVNSTEFTVCSQENLLYFSQLKDKDNSNLLSNLLNEFEKAEELLAEKIQFCFLSGESLSSEFIEEVKSYFNKPELRISRFNSFRMLTTNLGNGYREYCSRMAHVFPPCIGAGLPDKNKEITIYK